MFENASIDLFTLLVFIMPGFFFLKFFSDKERSGFEYTMLSLFWGIILVVFYYYILPIDTFMTIIKNEYAIAVVFSIFSIILALLIRFFIEKIKELLNINY